jgi:hypothetical protein
MAGFSYKGGIKAYWKRRGYDRIDDDAAAQRRPRLPSAELAPARRRRGWRVRRVPGRALRALSPRRLVARLRDAYVNAMLRLASSAAPYCTAEDPFTQPRPLVREYDEKALVEIYRSILARGEAAPVVSAARLPAVV